MRGRNEENEAAQRSGRPLVVAALLVAGAVVAGSWVLARSLDRVAGQLEGATARLEAIRVAVVEARETLANARPAVAPQRGPDPNRRHAVNIAGAPVLGPETAAVTIVEFSDFQCPFCSRVGPTLKQIREAYPEQVRIVFKHLPLDIHPKAVPAHVAAEAAARQGKFWEMHDRIFANQREMTPEKYAEWAAELGLDVAQFEADRTSAEVRARVDGDKREAQQLGATGTPAFFVNGKYLSGAKPFEAFKEMIDAELAAKSS